MRRKNKKRMSRKKKIIVFFLLTIILIGVIFFLILKPETNKTHEKTKIVDKIDNFEYTVNSSDTKLFKDKFKELKEELSKKEIDNKKYSQLISELFVIDFFTLDNKITKNDIRSVQFVYDNYKTDFIDKTRDIFYKQIENNLDGKRTQNLPEVESISDSPVSEVSVSDEFKTDELKNITEAYKVNVSWEYKGNSDYQTKGTFIVVKDGNKMSIAKFYKE